MGYEDLTCHVESLTRFARTISCYPLEAEDLVQETFRRVLGSLQDGRSIDNPRAYLFAALANLRADGLARVRRHGEEVPIELNGLDIGLAPAQEGYMAWGELVRALGRLSAGQQDVVRLVALGGMSYQEAAETLKVPIGTVMSRLNRARRSLRCLLEEGAKAA